MARSAQVDKYIRNKYNTKSVEKAIKNYTTFQKERHNKRDFAQEIARYKERMLKFSKKNPTFDRTSIKKIYLDSFHEEINDSVTMDIFDNVFSDEEQSDNEGSYVGSESGIEHSEDEV